MIRTLPRRPVLSLSSILVLIFLAPRLLRLITAAGVTTRSAPAPMASPDLHPREPQIDSRMRPIGWERRPLYQASRQTMPEPALRGRRVLTAFTMMVMVGLAGTSLARASAGSHPAGTQTAAPAPASETMSMAERERPSPAARSLVMAVASVTAPADDRTALLPVTALPARMELVAAAELANEQVATLFHDEGAGVERTTRALAGSGRTGGSMAAYRAAPGTAATVTALSTSLARYEDATAARAALTDPAVALALPALGLRMQERASATGSSQAGEQSRVFVGTSTGEEPGLTTYLVMFHQGDVVGAVTVTLPVVDDGGRTAMAYAQLQAAHILALGSGQP